MNCEIWEEQIAYMVDGESASAALDAHLAACANCRALLEGLRSDQEALRSTWMVPQVPRQRRSFRAAAAVLAIAAGLAMFFLWPRPSEVSTPPPPPIAKAPAVGPPEPLRAAAVPPKRQVRARKVDPLPTWEEFLDEFGQPPPPPRAKSTEHLQAGVRVPTTDPNVIILMLQPETIQKGTP